MCSWRLENIQDGRQVLLVTFLTVTAFHCFLHLEARVRPQTALRSGD